MYIFKKLFYAIFLICINLSKTVGKITIFLSNIEEKFVLYNYPIPYNFDKTHSYTKQAQALYNIQGSVLSTQSFVHIKGHFY